jgi:hypothetical protein
LRLPVTGSSAVAPPPRKEGAQLERNRGSRRIRADDTEVEIDEARLECEHPVGVREEDGDPARAVVRPGGIDDVAAVDAPHGGDVGGELLVDRSAADAAWGSESESITAAANGSETGAVLLATRSLFRGVPPSSSQAWQVPSVGCPANDSSLAPVLRAAVAEALVKMRTQ